MGVSPRERGVRPRLEHAPFPLSSEDNIAWPRRDEHRYAMLVRTAPDRPWSDIPAPGFAREAADDLRLRIATGSPKVLCIGWRGRMARPANPSGVDLKARNGATTPSAEGKLKQQGMVA
jgi:hypothetical protein